jgi:uncharacterized protein (DUF3820 family)
MPRLFLAIFGSILGYCGKRFPKLLQKLPGFFLGWFGRRLIKAGQINRLAAIALDADASDAITIALHGQMRLTTFLQKHSLIRRGRSFFQRLKCLSLFSLRDNSDLKIALLAGRHGGNQGHKRTSLRGCHWELE